MPKKKNKGGRPKGSKDLKPRKRRGSESAPNPWALKKKGNRSSTNKRLLLDQLKKYNFDVVQEVLWLYDQLKLQYHNIKILEDQKEIELTIYPKDITAQMLDILKLLVGHSFPKMKALELATSHDNPITLNFNLGGQVEQETEPTKVVQPSVEAIDMISGPGGIHLPVDTNSDDDEDDDDELYE